MPARFAAGALVTSDPVLAAVGLTLALVGVTVSIIFTIVGLLITIPVLVRWIRSSRDDIAELPPGH